MIVSGDLGRHGIAILSVREGLEFESPILSDCANLWPAVEALLNAGIEIHCLRDLTRGGLATTLNEIAADRNVCIQLEETRIPVEETVQSACEILGLDPLYVANEGRFASVRAPGASRPGARNHEDCPCVPGIGSCRKSRREPSPHGGVAKPNRR